MVKLEDGIIEITPTHIVLHNGYFSSVSSRQTCSHKILAKLTGYAKVFVVLEPCRTRHFVHRYHLRAGTLIVTFGKVYLFRFRKKCHSLSCSGSFLLVSMAMHINLIILGSQENYLADCKDKLVSRLTQSVG